MTVEEVLESLADECRDDHVGLWEVVDAVKQDLGLSEPTQVHQATLHLVRELLERRGVQAGHPAPDGRHFVPWNQTAEQAVATIQRDWSALGREPDIGEIAWFSSDAEGR
jgi:hypothetical protein